MGDEGFQSPLKPSLTQEFPEWPSGQAGKETEEHLEGSPTTDRTVDTVGS